MQETFLVIPPAPPGAPAPAAVNGPVHDLRTEAHTPTHMVFPLGAILGANVNLTAIPDRTRVYIESFKIRYEIETNTSFRYRVMVAGYGGEMDYAYAGPATNDVFPRVQCRVDRSEGASTANTHELWRTGKNAPFETYNTGFNSLSRTAVGAVISKHAEILYDTKTISHSVIDGVQLVDSEINVPIHTWHDVTAPSIINEVERVPNLYIAIEPTSTDNGVVLFKGGMLASVSYRLNP